MSSGSSASFCLIVCFLVGSSEAEEYIISELGQDVTLRCKADNNKPITAVAWSRPDLLPDYVLLFRDDRFDPVNQHPSYKNRVDLKDREMKDGDVSLVLKNVTMEDRGRYMCRVVQGEKYSNTIYLEVLPPDIPVYTGETVTVTFPHCSTNPSSSARVQKSGSSIYIDSCMDGHPIEPDQQDPSFVGRVEPMECPLTVGTVSVTLKNLTREHTGEYEWVVKNSDGTECLSKVYLNVTDRGAADGDRRTGDDEKRNTPNAGVIVGSVVAGVVAAVTIIVIIIMFIRFRRWTMTSTDDVKQQKSDLPLTYREVDQLQV